MPSPETAADERTAYLATMAHDLRTPLTALRGALGLMERSTLPPELLPQMVALMRRASDRLERLTLALISIDLIDNGTMSVLREVVDLREIAEDSVAVTRREHPAVELELPSEPILVACDRERAMQALDHLLDNARKFGGEAAVRVVVSGRGDAGVVSVTDEGPGIPEDERERIFERYAQLGERLPNEPRGAGVGLYLARWNAEAMGGSLTIRDSSDTGSTFELALRVPPTQ